MDAGGARLRLRALHVMGHSSARIARAVGASDKTIRKLVRSDAKTISPQLHDAIADVYDAWWDKRAPGRTRAERTAATTTRRRAIGGNWCAGAALDDELDTPGYRPTSGWKHATGTGTAPDIHPPRRPPRSKRPMTLTIQDESISSDTTRHTARLVPGHEHAWQVSWLPGHFMDRNTAITAMTLAEVVATDDVNPGQRLWLHIEGWAAELGLKAPDALTWISQPAVRVDIDKEAVVLEDPEAAGA
jgi:hypothetical protein